MVWSAGAFGRLRRLHLFGSKRNTAAAGIPPARFAAANIVKINGIRSMEKEKNMFPTFCYRYTG